jgi:hypothetical protein
LALAVLATGGLVECYWAVRAATVLIAIARYAAEQFEIAIGENCSGGTNREDVKSMRDKKRPTFIRFIRKWWAIDLSLIGK